MRRITMTLVGALLAVAAPDAQLPRAIGTGGLRGVIGPTVAALSRPWSRFLEHDGHHGWSRTRSWFAVDGVTITGSVTVPNMFAVNGSRTGTSVHVEWPRVAGSAQYSLGVEGNSVRFVTDTFADVTTSLAPTDTVGVRVKAMDANLSRLIGNDRLRRSGIDGGYGVFGAITTAILTIPPGS